MKSPENIPDDPDTLIKVEGVSKKFCLSLKKSLWYGLQDMGRELTGRRHGVAGADQRLKAKDHRPILPSSDPQPSAFSPQPSASSPPLEISPLQPSAFNLQPSTDSGLRPKEFWAVKDISFELKRGECLGLIGRNGAGKTTLLKMLNGLIKPDAGRIEMRGRVGAIISLGAGFNGILTGRENIYTNASVLGFSKREIDTKLDEIIDFAEIGEFIDTPVQNYSSGMTVRLGFAIATTLQPDILLLDEVLAVGDASFRNKCYQRIASMRRNAAVIFVSHDMDQIAKTCDNGLVLAKGKAIYSGDIGGAIIKYEALNENAREGGDPFVSVCPPITEFRAVFGASEVKSGSPVTICIEIESTGSLEDFLFRVIFYNATGACSADCGCYNVDCGVKLRCGKNRWNVVLASIPLKNGTYQVAFNVLDRKGAPIVWAYKSHVLCVYGARPGAIADCQLTLDSWEYSVISEKPKEHT